MFVALLTQTSGQRIHQAVGGGDSTFRNGDIMDVRFRTPQFDPKLNTSKLCSSELQNKCFKKNERRSCRSFLSGSLLKAMANKDFNC